MSDEEKKKNDKAIEFIENNWISQKDAKLYRLDNEEEIEIVISDITKVFDILKGEENDI